MDLADAPLYLLAPEIRAKRFSRDTTVRISVPDGTKADPLAVPAGHWAIIDADGAFEVDDAVFRARFVAVPGDPRSFASRGRPLRAVIDRKGVTVDSHGPISNQEFTAAAVRIAADGNPLCRVSWPMWRQAELLLAAGTAGVGHLAALRSHREVILSSIIQDPQIMADVHMLDAVLAGKKDRVGAGMAALHAAVPPSGLNVVHDEETGGLAAELDEKSVRARLARGIGIDPLAFLDVRHTPTYNTDGFRAMARTWLSPYLGERALEDVLVLAVPAGEKGDHVRAAIDRWLESGDSLIVGPKAAAAEMPGYETSELRHYRFPDGIDAVVFDDIFGSYVYAWRTPGVPQATSGADEDEQPQPPRLH